MIDLPSIVEQSLMSEPDTWDDTRIHASDLPVAVAEQDDKKCPRQLWLRLRGAEKKVRHRGELLMLKHGSDIHESIVPHIESGLPGDWCVVGREQAVEYEGVTGRYDLALSEGPFYAHTYIVDFKTIRGRAFHFLDGPKPAHELQVRFYIAATNSEGGLLLYIDREGQNYMRQFTVGRDDKQVDDAITVARAIACQPEPPSVLMPKLQINANKGPDSVKILMPWQCSYCDYIDISCPGALRPEARTNKIVGHIDNGQFVAMSEEYESLTTLVEYLREGESCTT